MLDIILKILCVLGIVLLVLLGIVLVTLLLVLFFPINYRLQGKKNSQEMTALARVNWLFGFLRLRYSYPEPGSVVVKLLCFTVFDSKKAAEKKKAEENKATKKDQQTTKSEDAGKTSTQNPEAGNGDEALKKEMSVSNGKSINSSIEKDTSNTSENGAQEKLNSQNNTAETSEAEAGEQPDSKPGIKDRIIAKYEKIRYTILKIYDKIKHIVDNITFYKELLQEEQTKELFRHAMFRLGRIWKNVHPRKLKGDILFGANSPDTTGYVLAVYGMLSPWLGNHINITPDFTRAILEGELYVAGHITIFQVVFHSARLALDKRLQLLIKKIKKHNKVSA